VKMIMAQAGLETRTLLRNGEQLLLTLIIPVLLLTAFTLDDLVKVGAGQQARVDFLVPGVIALAVLSTAFTSQAIATGFERRYGVLKRLGSTPLQRSGLITAKTLTVLVVELLLAVVMAGTLRAEATLAAANLIYLIMLGLGGVVFPLTRFPASAQPWLKLLP